METEDLGNSRFIDLHKTSSYPEVAAVVDWIFLKLPRERQQTGKEAEKTKQHIKTLIIDLFSVYTDDPSRWIGYSRDPKFYADLPDRYNSLQIKRKRLKKIIDNLEEMKLVKTRPGWRAMEGYAAGRRSRVRARGKLIKEMQNHGVQPHMIERCIQEETIILRGNKPKKRKKKGNKKANKRTKGVSLCYDDTDETVRMRKNIRRINDALDERFIDLFVPDAAIQTINQQMRRDPYKTPFEPSRKHLKRIFNNGSFDQGGRFYGVWWEEIPNKVDEKWRRYITIDNEPTVEVDYPQLHISMLYASEGLEITDEKIYDLPGIGPEHRSFLKAALNILINSSNVHEAVGAMQNEAREHKFPQTQEEMHKVVSGFKEKLGELQKYLHTGHGLKLMRTDSDMAEQVMLRLLDRGIIALPVHDSFIVKEQHGNELAIEMLVAFQQHCGQITKALVPREIPLLEPRTTLNKVNAGEGPDEETMRMYARYFARLRNHVVNRRGKGA